MGRMVQSLARRLDPDGTSPVIIKRELTSGERAPGTSRFSFGISSGTNVVGSGTAPLPSSR